MADKEKTTLILVSPPELSPLKEAERASKELQDIGVNNRVVVINDVLEEHDDYLSNAIIVDCHTDPGETNPFRHIKIDVNNI